MTQSSLNRASKLALEAAWGPTALGLASWQQLVAQSAFDQLEVGPQRLTPQIYEHLRECEELPERARLRGAYKQAWSKNQRILHGILPVIEGLNAANLPYRVIKGIACQLSIGRIGHRTLGDIDILVKQVDLATVSGLLDQNGFTCNSVSSCGRHSSRKPSEALDFHRGDIHVDVHIAEVKEPRALFARMLAVAPEEFERFGTKIKIPPPELLALHAAHHGGRGESVTDFVQATSDLMALAVNRGPINLTREIRKGSATANAMKFLHEVGSEHTYLRNPGILWDSYKPSVPLKQWMGGPRGLLSRAFFLWRIRFRGLKVVGATLATFQGRRVAYALWSLMGQFGVLEKTLLAPHSAFLRPPTDYVPDTGLEGVPVFRGQHKAVAASNLSTATSDYRFAIRPNQKATLVVVRLMVPGGLLEKAAVLAGGEEFVQWYPGQSEVKITIRNPGPVIEISVRPSTDVCLSCFNKLQELEVGVTYGRV